MMILELLQRTMKTTAWETFMIVRQRGAARGVGGGGGEKVGGGGEKEEEKKEGGGGGS